MKCQILFSGKDKKKYFEVSPAEIFTQSAKALRSDAFLDQSFPLKCSKDGQYQTTHQRTLLRTLSSGHTTLKQRRFNVDSTSRRCVPTGLALSSHSTDSTEYKSDEQRRL